MMTFDQFRESVRQDITREMADEATLKHFYLTRFTPLETIRFLKRTNRKTPISHQKARAMAGRMFRMLKGGAEAPSRDGGRYWVGWNGTTYYKRPNLRIAV